MKKFFKRIWQNIGVLGALLLIGAVFLGFYKQASGTDFIKLQALKWGDSSWLGFGLLAVGIAALLTTIMARRMVIFTAIAALALVALIYVNLHLKNGDPEQNFYIVAGLENKMFFIDKGFYLALGGGLILLLGWFNWRKA